MNRFLSVISILLLFCLTSTSLFAQQKTVEVRKDTLIDREGGVVLKDMEDKKISSFKAKSTSEPLRATLYSAVLPGLGQAYNNKYWKIPILYGGLVALAYGIDWNHDRYVLLRRDLIRFKEGKERLTPIPSEISIRSNIDRFRRDRDYLIVVTGLVYALNIVDAHVDAHLKEFDVNEDLSMKIGPSFSPSEFSTMQASVSIKFYFR